MQKINYILFAYTDIPSKWSNDYFIGIYQSLTLKSPA